MVPVGGCSQETWGAGHAQQTHTHAHTLTNTVKWPSPETISAGGLSITSWPIPGKDSSLPGGGRRYGGGGGEELGETRRASYLPAPTATSFTISRALGPSHLREERRLLTHFEATGSSKT